MQNTTLYHILTAVIGALTAFAGSFAATGTVTSSSVFVAIVAALGSGLISWKATTANTPTVTTPPTT